MEPEEVVRAYWERTQARDWAGLTALLAPDLVVEWPVTGERFTTAAALVGMNQAYPEGWTIHVRGVLADGDRVMSEVVVPQEGVGVFAAMSTWRVAGGRITEGREYWVTVAGEDPPGWRARFAERYDPVASRPGAP